MNQINVETRTIGTDRIIALVPGVGHRLAVSEARPSGRTTSEEISRGFALIGTKDPVLSVLIRVYPRKSAASLFSQFRAAGPASRPC